MGPIIEVGINREILTVLLNVLQGLATDVVRAGLLREECLRIKAQVITDGQNPPGPLRLYPTRPALQHRQGQRHAHALQKTAAVDRM
jgi:hypothetical protein